MIIGLPKEIKDGECRVALTPANVHSLKSAGHALLVEKDAGLLSGFDNGEYRLAGARLIVSPAKLWKESDIVVKVKEPQPAEYRFLHKGKILFCYLHLAANLKLVQELEKTGTSAIAAESVQDKSGRFPILEPMSEIAGRMAVIVGAFYQATPQGGYGVLISGLPGVLPAKVAILGGGTVGENAAKIASGMGAEVIILDNKQDRLRILDEILPENVSTLTSSPENIKNTIQNADIIIGAVLIPGARTPRLITKKMIAAIKQRAVFVDVSIDQGGIAETSKPTTHSQPTFRVGNVLHYCVANMPGAYGRTATLAYSNALMNYLAKLADKGLMTSLQEDEGFACGLNVFDGKLVRKEVGESLKSVIRPGTRRNS